MKFNITMPDGMYSRLERWCSENDITKSGAIQLALTNFLHHQDMIASVITMSNSLASLASNAEAGVDVSSELAELEALTQRLFDASV